MKDYLYGVATGIMIGMAVYVAGTNSVRATLIEKDNTISSYTDSLYAARMEKLLIIKTAEANGEYN